jgi:hypothetical protein
MIRQEELISFLKEYYKMDVCTDVHPELIRIYHRESQQMLYIRKRRRYFGVMIRLHFFSIRDAFSPMTPRIAYAQLRLNIQLNRNSSKHK